MKHEQWVIGKAKYTLASSPSRLEGDGEELYRELYCACGDMENRIKGQQMDLFAVQTSCRPN